MRVRFAGGGGRGGVASLLFLLLTTLTVMAEGHRPISVKDAQIKLK
jgi:hypothetical protein